MSATFFRPEPVAAPASPHGALSAGLPRPGARRAPGAPRSRELMPALLARGLGFVALAAFAGQAWARMVRPEAGGRLLGAVVVAAAVAAGLVALRGTGAGPARRAALLALSVASLAAALLLAGVPLRLLDVDEWGVLLGGLAGGTEAVPGLTIPYRGVDEWSRVVVVLGGTGLVLGAALAAFWPRLGTGPGGRYGHVVAAVGLAVLYATPAVQLRHDRPFLSGATFAVLLAAFLWLERLARREAPLAVAGVVAAALAGLALAPRLDALDPWVDYESIAQRLSEGGTTSFNWNHGYGPLNWPRDGREVMRVRARRKAYWKATVLTEFDGVRWRGARDGMFQLEPEAEAVRGGTAYSGLARWEQGLRVTLGDMRTRSFIAAGTTLEIRRSPRLVVESGLGSYTTPARPLRRGHSYLARVYSPRPEAEDLQGLPAFSYVDRQWTPYLSMRLPRALGGPVPVDPATGAESPDGPAASIEFAPWASGRPAEVANAVLRRPVGDEVMRRSAYGPMYELSRRLARESGSPYAFVRAVQQHLATGFAYTEDPPAPGPGRTPLDAFLFRDRAGYCQQFSGAMALMLRMGGIPARVAGGFTPGARDEDRGDFVVRDVDAHSWVEAYFPTVGWVTFDPTPAVAPPRSQEVGATPQTLPSEAAGGADARGERQTGVESVDDAVAGGGGPSPVLALLGLAVVAAAGATVPLARRARRRRDAAGIDGEVAALERALRRAGRPVRPGETLSRLEHELRDAPAAAAYVGALRRARFGWDRSARPTDDQRRALRRELAVGGGPLARLRALWALPPW
jgi:transglutaminase-like putative cysteine protease